MKQPPAQAGFTLIEILVVSGLSIMLLLTISAMFMTFLVGNSSTNIRKTLNTEGNYALSQVAFILRNAIEVNTSCTGVSDVQISVDSVDGGTTVFAAQDVTGPDGTTTRLASNSANLTSEDVTLTGAPSFTCTQQGNAKYVTVAFELRHSSMTGPDALTESFSTEVLLRN